MAKKGVVAERFSQNLSAFCEEAGLSQEALATRAAVHRTQVGQLIHGKQIPRLDTVVRLAGALGVSIADLTEGLEWEPSEVSGEYEIKPRRD